MTLRCDGARALRFLVVGLSNTAISGAVFWLCHRGPIALPSAFSAQIVAYSCGLAWSYFWNRTWTFGASGRVGASALRFVALQLVLLALSAIALGVVVDAVGAPVLPAWLGVMTLVTLLNYIGQRSVVFGSGTHRRVEPPGLTSASTSSG